MSLYIESINIKNFRAIKELDVIFHPGVNLIIGNNGTGKTSVIEAIKVGLGTYMLGVVGQSTPGIRIADIRIESKTDNGIVYHTPTEVSGVISFDGSQYEFSRNRKSEIAASKTYSSVSGLTDTVSGYMNSVEKVFPVLYYRSDELKVSDKGDDRAYIDRRQGYYACLDGVCDRKEIESWCLAKELEAFQKEKVLEDYEAFKTFCSEFMGRMNEKDEMPELYYSKTKKCMAYYEEGREYPIEYLSSGYRTVLWTIMDIAHRIAILNPQLRDYSQVGGVIVIDEIDAHLHPRWQWNVLSVLQSMLPKVQFIIATHSPIVISSVRGISIIRMSDATDVEYLEDAYAYTVGDVLEFRLGSGEIPADLETMYQKFEHALNRGDIEEAKETYLLMKEEYGGGNTLVKNAAFEMDLTGEE